MIAKGVKIFLRSLTILLGFCLCTVTFGRVEFAPSKFSVNDFQNSEDLGLLCNNSTSSSFWCNNLDAQLVLITTKGKDIFFNDAGEIVALYAKMQRGQDFRGRYNLEGRQNLIPSEATIPGGAILIDNEYILPTENKSNWKELDKNRLLGEFSYQVGNYQVEKSLIVTSTDNTINVSITVSPLSQTTTTTSIEEIGSENLITEEVKEPNKTNIVNNQVSYAFFTGIARTRNPIIKIAGTEINPFSNSEVTNPSYVSLQNKTERGVALILQPKQVKNAQEFTAVSSNGTIALSKSLANDITELELSVYGGPNELVRFYQEGLYELPDLFKPNIIGKLSLGVLAVLEFLHKYIGNWGLSIIALTLLFRILIWPLMTTQTKSMVGMQKLQPKLKAIQKKYKDNREKIGAETMKLYKEAGINPAMGCLPIVVQMPLFYILWRVFMNYEFNERFLWVPDLGLADPTYLLPILYVGIMITQSFLTAKGNPQQLQQVLIFNVVFAFIMINFPAGVLLYWVTAMLIQVGQHYLIQRSLA